MKKKWPYVLIFLTFLISLFLISSQDKVFSINNIKSNIRVQNKTDELNSPSFTEALNSKFKNLQSSDEKQLSKYLNFNHISDSNVVFIHFWATWCVPCIEELPALVQYAKNNYFNKNKNSTQFVFVSVNDNKDQIVKFLKSKSIDYQNYGIWLMDNENEAYVAFRVDKLPETFVISKDSSTRLQGAQEWR